MSKKTIAIIAGVSALVLVVVLAVVATLQGDESSPGEQTPELTPSTQISEADRQEIQSLTNQFVNDVGTFGWFSNTVADPVNAARGYEFFMEQSRHDADAIRSALVTLTGTRNYDAQINDGLFLVPFSVETSILDDITVPSTPTAEGGLSYIPVSVPIESTLIWVAEGMNYFDLDGNPVFGGTTIERYVFEGTLSLRFVRQGDGWVLSSFTQDTGVFPTDNWGFPNGGLLVETEPVRFDVIEVSP